MTKTFYIVEMFNCETEQTRFDKYQDRAVAISMADLAERHNPDIFCKIYKCEEVKE